MSEFKPRSWSAPVQDLVKEYNDFDAQETAIETQDKPDSISTSLVRRGLMDPNTGCMTNNSKQGTILRYNVSGYSPSGKENYRRIFGHP